MGGQTFNAYGAADLGLGIPQGGSQVTDNVLAGDVVSAGHHFGQVVEYATPRDTTHFKATGYLDGAHGFPDAVRAMQISDHGSDNFAPDPGKGASVLTEENKARDRAHRPLPRGRADDPRQHTGCDNRPIDAVVGCGANG